MNKEITADVTLTPETTLMQMLKAERQKRKMTQTQLAKKLGKSLSTICRWEDSTNDEMNFGDFYDYAEAVGVTFDVMMEPKDMSESEQIRQECFKIAMFLKRLMPLLKSRPDGKELAARIHEFQGAVLFPLVYNEI